MDGQQAQPQPQPQLQQQPGNGHHQQWNWLANGKIVQYTSAEVYALAEQMLHVDAKDWEEVVRLHSLNFPTTGKDSANLKHKFQQLYRVEMPTSDPMCPPDVRMAKRMREQIWDKAEINNGEGELVIQDSSFQEDLEGQPFDPVDDISEGEEGVDEEPLENNNNNINDEYVAVGNANNVNGSVTNQARPTVATTNINRALMPIKNNIGETAYACKSQKKV